MGEAWPKPLASATGPVPAKKLDGALAGMGDWGQAVQQLAAAGYVQPDILTAQTLFLLSNQPRDPQKQQSIPGGAGGVAGGVWVRERYTLYRPLARDDAFVVTGHSMGRHVHKGRRYGTTQSETRNTAGEVVARNVTTGLLAYKVEDGLADNLEGVSPDEVEAPGPDWQAAANNPAMAALKTLQTGDHLSNGKVAVTLAMMAARDTDKPDNPIHSDPELARKAGLKKPIAGGSHVLAFATELLMQRAGAESLLHGTFFDVRWKAPVFADTTVEPEVVISEAAADRVIVEASVRTDAGATAMVAQLVIPLV